MEITLVLSRLIFMMVIAVRDSVIILLATCSLRSGADVTLQFEDQERIDSIRSLTMAYPGVSDVEVWDLRSVSMRPAAQPESEDDQDSTVFGVPLPTDLYGYQLLAGRWLDPQDTYAIVLNQHLANDVGVGVGDWVTVKYDDKRSRDWQVVGLVFDPVITNSANVPLNVICDIHQVGRSSSVWIRLENQDQEAQIAIAKDLRAYFEKNNVDISAQRGVFGVGGDATVETARAIINQFNFVVILLAVMAIIIGLVGSIALSGALSLSVMERIREIGVLRAIGASNWQVARLFIGEGLILGWLSWLIALPLSIPAGKLMVVALGSAFQIELVYKYSPIGAVLWLAIITVLSVLASWIPARGATRVSVRQSLAYQ
jgi:putative ABC transport system permease protein